MIDLWPESMPLEKFKNNIVMRKWKKLRDDSINYIIDIENVSKMYQK